MIVSSFQLTACFPCVTSLHEQMFVQLSWFIMWAYLVWEDHVICTRNKTHLWISVILCMIDCMCMYVFAFVVHPRLRVKRVIHFCFFSICLMLTAYTQKIRKTYKSVETPSTPPCACAACLCVRVRENEDRSWIITYFSGIWAILRNFSWFI